MEVGVVLAGQMMKTLKYLPYIFSSQTIATIHFFISIRTELSGVFYLYQNRYIGFLLDRGYLLSSWIWEEEIGDAKTTSPPEDLSCDTRE